MALVPVVVEKRGRYYINTDTMKERYGTEDLKKAVQIDYNNLMSGELAYDDLIEEELSEVRFYFEDPQPSEPTPEIENVGAYDDPTE